MVYVVIEARWKSNTRKAEQIWELLSEVYAANRGLSELSKDRRKAYAVELMVAAWKPRDKFLFEQSQRDDGYHPPKEPAFLVALEVEVAKLKEADTTDQSKRKHDDAEIVDLPPVKKSAISIDTQPQVVPMGDPAIGQFDFDFDDVDWSFWNAIT